jgi:autotransporter-associated beta strand protein
MKRGLFAGLSVWVPVMASGFTFSLEHRDSRPNLILILIDDMGWSDSSTYGSTYFETPNLTRLASEGMLFTSAYAAPLCSPTRASILSGQHPARLRLTQAITSGDVAEPQAQPPADGKYCGNVDNRDRMPLGIETLADVLKNAGYLTAHIGKWHLAPKGADIGYYAGPRGFDFVIGGDDAPGPGPKGYYSPYNVPNLPPGPEGEYLNERLAQEAVDWIQSVRDSKKPFYLNFWHYAVHSPVIAKQDLLQKYKDKTDPRGVNCPEMATMIESMDYSVGMLLDWLDLPENLAIKTNTAVVLVSDNGGVIHKLSMEDESQRQPTSNRPLRAGKGSTYEGGIRVPWIVRWAGNVPSGAVCSTPVSTEDIYPTFLEIAGVSAPAGQAVDGRSVLPLFRGESMTQRPQFTHFPHLFGILCAPSTSVRLGDYKLIRFHWAGENAASHYHELYDLENDPWESVNLAAQMPGKVDELSALVDAFLQDKDALIPLRNMEFTGNPRTKRGQESAAPGRPLSIRLSENTLVAAEERGSREIRLLDQTGNWCETAAVVVEGGGWVRAENHPDGRAELFWDRALYDGPAKVLFGWSGGLNHHELNDWTMDACALTVNPSGGEVSSLFRWTGGGANSSWGTAANWSESPGFYDTPELVWSGDLSGSSIKVYSFLGESRAVRSLKFEEGFNIGAGNATYTIRLRSGATDGAVTLLLRDAPSITLEQNLGAGKDLKTVAIGNNAGAVELRGDLAVNQNSTNVLLSFNAAIGQTGGPFSINKNGAGTMELYRNNTFSGGVNLNAGTVIVRNAATAAGTGVITLGAADGAESAALAVAGAPGAARTFANPVTVQSGDGARTILNHDNGLVPTLSGTITLYRNIEFNVTDYSGTQNSVVVSGAISGAGGIRKNGTGTLEFAGTNTFSGDLVVNSGTVILAGGGSLRLMIGSNGTGSRLSGEGSLILHGTLEMNLEGAGTVSGDSWPAVTAGNVTYGAGFSVSGFTNRGGGLWTKEISEGTEYRFNQANGMLTVEAKQEKN